MPNDEKGRFAKDGKKKPVFVRAVAEATLAFQLVSAERVSSFVVETADDLGCFCRISPVRERSALFPSIVFAFLFPILVHPIDRTKNVPRCVVVCKNAHPSSSGSKSTHTRLEGHQKRKFLCACVQAQMTAVVAMRSVT